jgi:hypothetical protein
MNRDGIPPPQKMNRKPKTSMLYNFYVRFEVSTAVTMMIIISQKMIIICIISDSPILHFTLSLKGKAVKG